MNEPSIMLASWGGAKYLDWWMLVHLLGGLALGYAARTYGLSIYHSFIVVGILLISWEIFEKVAHIAEHWVNGIIDLALGFVGIGLAFALPLAVGALGSVSITLILLMVWSGINLWGWISWLGRQ